MEMLSTPNLFDVVKYGFISIYLHLSTVFPIRGIKSMIPTQQNGNVNNGHSVCSSPIYQFEQCQF